MKLLRTAIASALSLIPIGQPMGIGTGLALTSASVILSSPEKAMADNESKYIQSAFKKIKNGANEEAISDLNQAIIINPRNLLAYKLRGLVKRELEDFEGAILDFTQAIKINPKNAESYYFRGEAKLNSIDISNRIATYVDKDNRVIITRKSAISDFDMAIKLNSKKAEYYTDRGYAKSLIRDHKGAINDWDKALNLDKDNYNLNRRRGISKNIIGDSKGACQDFKKAAISGDSIAVNLVKENCQESISIIEQEEKRELALTAWRRGVENELSGNYKEAINDFNRAIELDPTLKYMYNSRAIAKGNLGDIKGAIEDYTKGLEIDPGDPLMYRNRGTNKADLNDHKGAISDYDKAIDITPDDYYAYYLRGRSKGALGDYSGEISDHSKSLELKKDSFQVYYERAYAKIETKDFEGAISDLSKAIAINPNFPEAYNLRGYSKGAGLNDKQGACSDFKKSASLGSEYRIKWLQGEEGAWCRNMPD